MITLRIPTYFGATTRRRPLRPTSVRPLGLPNTSINHRISSVPRRTPRCRGGGRFEDVSISSGVAKSIGMGMSLADFDDRPKSAIGNMAALAGSSNHGTDRTGVSITLVYDLSMRPSDQV